MKEWEDSIEKMSEEMAHELIKAFDDFTKDANDLHEHLMQFNKTLAIEMTKSVTTRFLYLVEHYVNSTRITRWYWKRKIHGMMNKTLPQLFYYLSDLKQTN